MTADKTPAGPTQHPRRRGAGLRAAILALAAAAWAQAAPTVSPYLTVTVPGGGGLTDLFTFPMPPACSPSPCTDQRVMLAKLVVDETAGDLSFEIRSTTSAVSKYPVTAFSTLNTVTPGTGTNVSLPDNELGTQAAVVRARFTTEPAKAGFKILTLLVRFDNAYDQFPPGEIWKISANPSPPADDHYAGFRVDDVTEAAADPLVTRSHVTFLPASLNFGPVQINLPVDQSPVLPYSIQNGGTGPLTLSGSLNPPASAFSIFGSVIVSPMNPMEKVDVSIQFRPTVLGEGPQNQVALSIASNDPSSPSAFSLSGTGVTLDAILLMDISGSMSFFPNSGEIATDELDSRLWRAKLGGRQLFQAYKDLTGGNARFGLYLFPSPTPENVSQASAFRRVPIQTSSGIGATVEAALDRMPPVGSGLAPSWAGTPMAEGIKIAQADLNTASSTYRPAILLLSDGAHNLNSASPPADPDAWIPQLSAKGIRVFPVSYGENSPGVSDVNLPQLQRLADGTTGKLLGTNPSDPTTLPKAFRGALREWLGLNIAADPKGTIQASQDKVHEVCIDPSAYTITFVVDWNKNVNNAINFQLTSPQGQNISGAGTGVSFYAGMTYGMYVVKGNLVRGGKGAGRWKLRLKGASSLGGNLDYSYNVLTQSAVNLKSNFGGKFHTGFKDVFAVQVERLPFPPPPDGKVMVAFDVPEMSFGTYLATAKVDPQVVINTKFPDAPGGGGNGGDGPDFRSARAAAPAAGREPLSLAQRKALALARDLKQPFPNQRRTGQIELVDNGKNGDLKAGDGIFSTNQVEFLRDGLYNYHLQYAAENVVNKACFNFEDYVSTYVKVRLTTALFKDQVKWEKFTITPFYDSSLVVKLQKPAPEGFERMGVVVTPKDEQGNYFGTGRVEEVRFALAGAEALGAPVDNLDGSYTQVAEFKQGTNPQATVTIGDAKSDPVPMRPEGTQPPGKFPRWLILVLAILLLIIIVFAFLRKKQP